jgi:GPH family glycoside/pentoside/hexuronide:cation symporter
MEKEKKSKLSAEEVALPGLSGGQKFAYGVEDFGCNMAIGLISSFGLLYWGNVAGLNLGIVGTLLLVSKLLDGITDVIAGTIIDRTKSKFGKAKAWMIWTLPLMLIIFVAMFAIPKGLPTVAKYVFMFIAYTGFNGILYTMNNIAYSTLSVRCTRRESDKVQLGVLRFIFSTAAGVIIAAITSSAVDALGGRLKGWALIAIIYAAMYGICQIVTLIFVPELSDENEEQIVVEENPLLQIVHNLVYLVKNKYFLIHLFNMLLFTFAQYAMSSSGIYYMTYVYGNAAMFGTLSATTAALVVGLVFVPSMTKKFGIKRTVIFGMVLATAMGVVFYIAAASANAPLMIVSNILRWFGSATFIGTATVIIPGYVSEYSMLKDNVNIEATVFSCVSMGTKVGSGIASAVVGWLLSVSGYIAVDGATQPVSAQNMMTFMYAGLPFVALLIVLILAFFQNVETDVNRMKKQNEAQ